MFKTAGTLHHPDNFDTVRDDTVENEIAPDKEVTAFFGNIRAGRSKSRVVGQKNDLVFDGIQQAVRSAGIVLRDIRARDRSGLLRSVMSVE